MKIARLLAATAIMLIGASTAYAEGAKIFVIGGKPDEKCSAKKPLSQSSNECLSVMQAEQAEGEHFVQLGFMRRYDQSYVEILQDI